MSPAAPPPEEEPRKRAASGERSIDFGAELMRQAKKAVRKSERLDAPKPRDPTLERPPEPEPDLPREPVGREPHAPVARPKPPRRPLRTKLLALSLSLLCSLVVIELAARIFLTEPEQIRGKAIGPMAFYESLRYPVPGEKNLKPPYRLDRSLGFCLMGDYDQPQWFPEAPGGKYRLHTNGLGLRDDRTLLPKDGGSLRVLVVGDSMTFGIGVEREQAFPAVLERQLGSELGRPLDVVNAGVTCWGQREEVAFIEQRGLILSPDFVLLQFTVANDVLDNLRYQDGANDLIPDPRLGDDLAEHPLFELPLAETSRAYRLFAWHVGRHVVRYRAMMEPWRLERTRVLIRRARDAAFGLHAKFGLVIAPTIIQSEGSFAELLLRTHRINDEILRFAKEDGIPVFDPLPALRDARARGKRCYFPTDMHWSPEGHGVVGEGLAPWVAGMLR